MMDGHIDTGDRDLGDFDASEVATPVVHAWHESFAPYVAPKPLDYTPENKAKELLAELKKTLKPEKVKIDYRAAAWGVVPRGARRTVLAAAGFNPDEWERPIDSYTDTERAALIAAAKAAVRVYERVLNAI